MTHRLSTQWCLTMTSIDGKHSYFIVPHERVTQHENIIYGPTADYQKVRDVKKRLEEDDQNAPRTH